jgi:SpoVK/Ycf46/Vps4 family AAA+-type ATPase
MVVSKYIGETEKNLELLFARAEDKNWILFFDEADALFGKRTNVRDAHDKYANQEVSYLLQRIEDYNGLVILATNMKSNIDDAFLRRFNSILKFPVPTTEERTILWKKTFPENVVFWKKTLVPETAIGPEVVDVYDLIPQYELSGGSILNVVHYASIRGIEKYDEQKKNLEILNQYTSCPIPYPESVIYVDDIFYGIKKNDQGGKAIHFIKSFSGCWQIEDTGPNECRTDE